MRIVVAAIIGILLGVKAPAQDKPDPALLAAIEQIKAIDNHAHPMRLLGPGETEDLEVDALVSPVVNYPPPGAIIDALLERRYSVFSINSKQLDRFRDRFSVAGAKDDHRDARRAHTLSTY